MQMDVEDGDFDEKVLGANGPILVQFWAVWCGPCRATSPVLDEIAHENESRIIVTKMDIDQNPLTMQRYGVRGIPTMIIFRNGKPVSTKLGSLPKDKLLEWINSVIAAA